MSIKTGLLIVSLLASTLWIPAVHAETTAEQPNRQQTVTLNIQNMSCPMCTFTIKKALQKVDGVEQAAVDYDAKTATVTFDVQKTNSSALIKATTDAGYPASIAGPAAQ